MTSLSYGYAVVWRTGEVEVLNHIPSGSIKVAFASMERLKVHVSANSRHSYDGKTLLVTGIPEAKDDGEAMDALIHFSKRIKLSLAKDTEALT